MEFVLSFLEGMGMPGLLVLMAVLGLSIPIPGASVIIIAYGYISQPTSVGMLLISLGMSGVYTVSCFFPYWIGSNVYFQIRRGFKGTEFFKRGFAKAQEWFRKYGDWSVLLARPAGAGMFISYVAGMFKMRLWKYFVFTFMGIFPWSLGLLFLGKVYKNRAHEVMDAIGSNSIHVLLGLLVFYGVFLTVKHLILPQFKGH
mgnify:CR=1 FL=1